MATATYTCTVFNAQPKQAGEMGVISVSGNIAAGTTPWTIGDVIFLAKLPHGAKYVSCEFDHTTGAAAMGVSYGYASGGAAGGAASLSALVASGATATILRKTVLGVPADISVSDTHVVRYGILGAKIESGSPTAVTAINFTYCYRTDGAGG